MPRLADLVPGVSGSRGWEWTVYTSNGLPVDVASVDGGLCVLMFLPAVVDEQGFFSFP